MFKGQPKGLYALALANTGERFGYYTMLAVFVFFLRANFGLDAGVAGLIYSGFLGLVYFLPIFGGMMADKFGFGKMVTIGIIIMFLGYFLLSIPLGGGGLALTVMLMSLLLISFGTGMFKGNLQVMVGDLYNDPRYAAKRDSGFSLFYMAINIGALFAPSAAVGIKKWAEESLGFAGNDAYHFSFAVACLSLIVSILIYYIFRRTFRHVEGGTRKSAEAETAAELSPSETRSRIVALVLVMAVVIFFWMAFHQNGLTLNYFANEFTQRSTEGVASMPFNVWNLVAVIAIVYALFSIPGSSAKNKGICCGVVALASAFIFWQYTRLHGSIELSAPIFQQFNPFYVVALTPVSMAIFASLAKRGKEPSAPRKIAYGMLVAAVAFGVMAFASKDLNTPNRQEILRENAGVNAADAKYRGELADLRAELEQNKITSLQYDSEVARIRTAVDSVAQVYIPQEDKDRKAWKDNDETVVNYRAKIALLRSDVQSLAESLGQDKVSDDVSAPVVAPEGETEVLSADAETSVVIETQVGDTQSSADAAEEQAIAEAAGETLVSPYWLIMVYLILTFGELLLSPMGISFVSKVAPPKYKGMMMGLWFAATAIGNFLVQVGGHLWGGLPLWVVWGVFLVLCVISALIMFSMMKRLEAATNNA